MGKVTFITGGSRSGKSIYAVELAKKGNRGKTAFIATCGEIDKEMGQRIKLHRKARPGYWQTFEEPLEVSSLLKKISNKFSVIVIDCLTLLVSNLMLKGRSGESVAKEVEKILTTLEKARAVSIVVSNEVGMGIVPGNRLSRDFRDIAGRVNQIAAKHADSAFLMVSGIPWRIK